MERVIGLAYPENVASHRVMEKAGMRRVGMVTAYGAPDDPVRSVQGGGRLSQRRWLRQRRGSCSEAGRGGVAVRGSEDVGDDGLGRLAAGEGVFRPPMRTAGQA